MKRWVEFYEEHWTLCAGAMILLGVVAGQILKPNCNPEPARVQMRLEIGSKP